MHSDVGGDSSNEDGILSSRRSTTSSISTRSIRSANATS